MGQLFLKKVSFIIVDMQWALFVVRKLGLNRPWFECTDDSWLCRFLLSAKQTERRIKKTPPVIKINHKRWQPQLGFFSRVTSPVLSYMTKEVLEILFKIIFYSSLSRQQDDGILGPIGLVSSKIARQLNPVVMNILQESPGHHEFDVFCLWGAATKHAQRRHRIILLICNL